MKLLRYGLTGEEKPGIIDGDGNIRDLSGHVDDITGHALSPESLNRLRGIDVAGLPLVDGAPRIGACVGKVSKFPAIGLNYSDHAAEAGMPVPPEPVVFTKHVNCICGPDDDIEMPRGSRKLDWEVELCIVIGARAKYVEEKDAHAYVAGYCVLNDVSERTFQLERHGQWLKGKSHDTFGPVGPWLVTADEVPDPQNLAMWLDVNGERQQEGTTKTMVYGVAHIVSYLSAYMTLEPGDLIATGTPPGVGMGRKPQRFLKAGDVVELGIEGLGQQRQKVVTL